MERERLRSALRGFRLLVATHPGVGEEVERIGTQNWRVFPLHRQIPYLVWYAYDDGERDAPVTLVRLFHERQDHRRFMPR